MTRLLQVMASKRTLRVYTEETSQDDDEHCQKQMASASAYLSRRGSRNSLKDDMISVTEELDDGARNETTAWDSQIISCRPQNLASGGKETTQFGTSTSRFSEKSFNSLSSSSSNSDSVDNALPNPNERPLNFGLVVPGVYRSSYPKPQDYEFLEGLKLKTVITLVKKDKVDHDLDSFIAANGIRQIIFNMKGTKKEAIPISTMRHILQLALNRENHPLLVHCNHGKHRTGCVVAAIRKLSGWQLRHIVNEYKTYAEPKIRECDVDYISSFQCAPLQNLYDLYYEPTRFNAVQRRVFVRILLFSTFVMVLWLVSGSKMLVLRDNTALR